MNHMRQHWTDTWERCCWWLAERVPPRLARAVFTRVYAVASDPYNFSEVWDRWSAKHHLTDPHRPTRLTSRTTARAVPHTRN